MSHKIKMIGLDMDGTLLTTEKRLTSYTKAVLEKALEQGIEIVLSTGRSITGIPKDILEMQGMKYAVTINGAKIVDLRNGTILHENTLSKETALQLLDIVSEYDAMREAFVDNVCYSNNEQLIHANDYFEHPRTAEYIWQSRVGVEDVKATVREKNMPVDKVNGIFRSESDRMEAYERLAVVPGVVVVSSLGNNWEVNSKGTDKGSALLKLGDMLGIKREEIMACGDGMNDKVMLEAVGFGVAMENAEPDVKEAADYVTASNDDNGVAKAIEKFALK